ncbi:hypothetical protein IPZ61_03905 [Streptomyces sioyaensis]|uniref:hypothetical protein n=1 Tax=Streptomyces sioyaensis TaxID=67364 RepID=UPI0035AC20C7|nr:hypothetical protein [Streptomyces sioyaensis]
MTTVRPSGASFYDELRLVAEADAYLRELRFGRSRAVETTKSYAGGIVLYLRWCRDTRRDWRTAARDHRTRMAWLAGCRRRPRRYERKASQFLAFTSIACTLTCYRRLSN